MAMEVSTSTRSDHTKGETVYKERPIMPADMFMAARHGKSDFFFRHFGLPADHVKVTVKSTSEPDIDQIQKKHKDVQYNLESTTASGETVLHILIANEQNELAMKILQKNASLLKTQNNKLETPLHYAAKVGNVKIIQQLSQFDPVVFKNALKETNDDKDTTLHLAVKYNYKNVVGELLKLNHEMVYMVNNEGQSPFYIAIVKNQNSMEILEGKTSMVEFMLESGDNSVSLSCTQFSDGMFPIHVATRIGDIHLVKHLLQKYSNSAELQDQCGRNFLHIAAEENILRVLQVAFTEMNDMHLRMIINTKDYNGNTPLHIAAMKGNKYVMILIWSYIGSDSSKARNNEGLMPFDLSAMQLLDTNPGIQGKIEDYILQSGCQFTDDWFDKIMEEEDKPYENKWERSQLIGLGSVLIATVAFAAAFAVPGSYNADHGTPILGRRFMFRAFFVANALAFVQAFASVLTLVKGALADLGNYDLEFAIYMFVSAAHCMVLAFATGSYVMLAPINKPIAIIILVLPLLFASPMVLFLLYQIPLVFTEKLGINLYGCKGYILALIMMYGLPSLFIFCLAFLK